MLSVTRVPFVNTVTRRPRRPGVEIELREVGPHQHLAARDQEKQGPRGGDLVDERQEALEGHLAGFDGAGAHRLVHVAMGAAEVAAKRGLERPLDRDPLRAEEPLLGELGERDFGDGLVHPRCPDIET